MMLGSVACSDKGTSEETSQDKSVHELSLSEVVGQSKIQLNSDAEKFSRNINTSINEEDKMIQFTFYPQDGIEYTEELKTISLDAQKHIYSELEKYNFIGYKVITGFSGSGIPLVLIDADGKETINNYLGKESLDNSEVITVWKTGKSAKHHSTPDCSSINSGIIPCSRIYANELNPCSKCF